MSAKILLEAIVKSPRIAPSGYQAAAATTRDGHRVEGLVRNEDNFSVQLLTRDGNFHFFEKADLQSLEYLEHSSMPADYGKRLTPAELDDLVSYMMSVGSPESVRIPER